MTANAPPNTRLQGRWLAFARLVWLGVASLAVGLGVAGVPYAWAAYANVSPLATAELLAAAQAQGLAPQQFATLMVGSLLLAGAIWVALGTLIFIRRGDHWPAWVASFALVTFGTNTTLRGALAQAVPALAGLHHLLIVISWTALALFFALFPNGRFTPRWLRWFVLGWMVTLGSRALPEIVTGVAFAAFWALFLSAQIYRYFRVSTPTERQQTKWVFFGFVTMLVIYLSLFALFFLDSNLQNSPSVLVSANFIAVVIPLSIGVALLRSHLWDIDLLIRRTLQYSLLSGLLAFIYFGLIIGLQSVFATVSDQQSPIIIVLSTLAIAALFLPLRRQVQNFIDKRFYRQKYDAAKVVANFAATCRDETDLDKLTARLAEVVAETMQPESVGVWLKPGVSTPSVVNPKENS